ncbi:penicillin-binding transpeptidase domain-containing protein [Paenibacillus lautus]|uniref:Penicillin-binding protein 2 n=1 Tax=Paenibacillus lautus TaxID=1401 RepID=A0A385TI51_PAELA|nr:penicillin-binding transpeptidase domain-containing protein [Paenibacillus lautus]AYB42252.1 penicillin-binding protein 2 [Paenibacillus lautus]MCI1775610.1 penicillin-binding protein 2 [Paenibacillus lautus]VTR62673.1 peptidoglycan glycosyltransferase [Actinobacillus pleuropneumoniae]
MKGFRPDKRKQEERDAGSQFNLRVNLFFFSTFIIFCVIIIRLAILQFVEGPELKELETGGQVKNFPLQPIRGSIIDASGTPIAYSTPSQALYLTLLKDYSSSERGKKNRPEIEKLAEEMVKVFEQYGDPKAEKLTVDDVIKAMDLEFNKQPGYEPRRIKANLSNKEVAYFMEHKNDYPGLEVVEESQRQYNPDKIAVQTIGYLKEFRGIKTLDKYKEIDEQNKKQKDPGLIYTEQEKVGVDGLEMMFQDELRGKNGYIGIPINPQNMADGVPTMIAPEKGYNIHTTIHKDIQKATQQAIIDQLKWLHTNPFSGKTHPEALTGYAVAMEVDTGNIVAMASMPDYDPNVWENGTDDWETVMKYYGNGTISPYNSGRSGNNLESVVLLGSTVKPLSVLIGLNEKLFGPNDYYPDSGAAFFGKDNSRVQNSGGKAYGSLNARKAIEHSSNAFMVDWVGEKLWNKYGSESVKKWDEYMKKFGLGVSTESGLPKEHKGIIEYTNIEQAGSYLAAMAYASFGQSGKYTTLQLAQYASTLANRGERIRPQLASKIVDQDGNVIKEFKREVLNKEEFPQQYWNEVIAGMNTQGLRAFDGFGYDFARKTGTSEQDVYTNGRRNRRENGVFIAFAPRENPKLAVAVVIPEGGFGSQSAAPVARKIFDAYDEIYGLDGTPHPKTTEGENEDGSTNE